MPFITYAITRTTTPDAKVAEVHKELVALSLPIAKAELTAKRFGAAKIRAGISIALRPPEL